MDKFIARNGAHWDIDRPIGKEAVIDYLMSKGADQEASKKYIVRARYTKAYAADVFPGKRAICKQRNGDFYLNLWVPPTLVPKPAPYPRLDAALNWLVDSDKDGRRWLDNWIAYKFQNPAANPMTALVLHGSPGAGKGTLYSAIAEVLGPENCAALTQRSLTSRFNSRWINKLFVLGDELVSMDDVVDVSNELKVLIASGETEAEGKYQNQRKQTNRIAWIFASNDKITPVSVEPKDRRYTVFANHRPLPDGYSDMLKSCFSGQRPTESFLEEVAGWAHDLLASPADRVLASTPYENEARDYLISAALRSYDAFLSELKTRGWDYFAEVYKSQLAELGPVDVFDFGDDGVSIDALYYAYREYCHRAGMKPVKTNKFLSAVRNMHPRWSEGMGGSLGIPAVALPRAGNRL